MSDPTSWFAIERGWRVVGREDEEIGKVEQVTGDQQNDIFNGLVVSTRRGASRYVAAEHVAEIRTDGVRLDLDEDDLEALDESGPQDL